MTAFGMDSIAAGARSDHYDLSDPVPYHDGWSNDDPLFDDEEELQDYFDLEDEV